MFGLLRSPDFWNNKTDRVAVTSVLKTELKLFRFRGKHINKRYSPGSPPIPQILDVAPRLTNHNRLVAAVVAAVIVFIR